MVHFYKILALSSALALSPMVAAAESNVTGSGTTGVDVTVTDTGATIEVEATVNVRTYKDCSKLPDRSARVRCSQEMLKQLKNVRKTSQQEDRIERKIARSADKTERKDLRSECRTKMQTAKEAGKTEVELKTMLQECLKNLHSVVKGQIKDRHELLREQLFDRKVLQEAQLKERLSRLRRTAAQGKAGEDDVDDEVISATIRGVNKRLDRVPTRGVSDAVKARRAEHTKNVKRFVRKATEAPADTTVETETDVETETEVETEESDS